MCERVDYKHRFDGLYQQSQDKNKPVLGSEQLDSSSREQKPAKSFLIRGRWVVHCFKSHSKPGL